MRQRLSRYSGPLLHREIADVGDIPDILAVFVEFQPDILVINGGDGTVQAVLTESARTKPFPELPPILVLPGGKTNLIAEDLGGFATPEAIADALLPVLETGAWDDRLTQRSLIRLKVTPQDPPVYGAFFGTAAIVRGLDFVRRKIYPKGWPNWLAHSAAIVIVLFAGIFNRAGPGSPVRGDMATIEIEDGPKVRGRHFLIMATTLNRLLLGLKPFPASDKPELKVIGVKYAASTIIKGMVATLLGRLNGRAPAGMIATPAKKAWIQIDCPVTLDGEFYTPMPDVPVEISATRPVTFVRIAEQ